MKMVYSKVGLKLIKFIQKMQTDSGINYNIDYSLKMYLDYTNLHELKMILRDDPEKKIKKIFFDLMEEGDTAIDIGANIGEYALIASTKVKSKGLVIAIEPLVGAVDKLKKNFLLNNLNNYLILPIAVGNKSGKITMYENTYAGMLSSTNELNENVTKTKEIRIEKIDNLISLHDLKTINMMKIDVEGLEYDVLLGSLGSFKKNMIKNIICEIHHEILKKKGINEDKIYSLLIENGFSVSHISGNEKLSHILAKKIKN